MLLISIAALKTHRLPKTLNILGLVIAALGILSVVPLFKDFAIGFGLGQIVWFIWLGIQMLRNKQQSADDIGGAK